MPAALLVAVRRPSPCDQADGADDIGYRGHEARHHVGEADTLDDLRHEENDAVIRRDAHPVDRRQRQHAGVAESAEQAEPAADALAPAIFAVYPRLQPGL